ncbi:MAG TPA: quercetin 2,3-dioxygenase [Propionibacteriaceae bacterium]|nr:quercetin 2,3-dioxygenase [Propionibacteriaceae bacterium]
MQSDTAAPVEPILLGPDEGDARWWGDSLAIIRASADTTAGRITVIDNYASSGATPPLHIHHNEGEGFYLIDGTMTIWVGGKKIDASPGSYVYGPPGVPHTFVVTSPIARYLFITEPAGFDRFVRSVSTVAERLVLPPPSAQRAEDPELMARVAAEYGIEILGPPGIPSEAVYPGT